jgi:hypothetical protein
VLAFDVSSRLHEDALGQLRCSGRGRLFSGSIDYFRLGFGLGSLSGEFFAKSVSGNVINGAGSALHLEATIFQERNQLLVFHSDFFGKLVYTNTHK